MSKFAFKIRQHFRWTFHNLVAHPLSEIFHLIGASDLSNKIHDSTVPEKLDLVTLEEQDLENNIKDVLNPERDD
jgi:hypothetical protein